MVEAVIIDNLRQSYAENVSKQLKENDFSLTLSIEKGV